MSDEPTFEISAAVVRCVDGAPNHRLDRRSQLCAGCGRHVRDLRCPTHERVYSHNVEPGQNGGYLRKWICRVCLSEGTEPFPEAQEYQILRGRKLLAAPLALLDREQDSPQPDLRIEYPRRMPQNS